MMAAAAARRFYASGLLSTPPRHCPPARMNRDASRLSLLDDLDARQNALLEELERLNRRIEQVLQACGAARPEGSSPRAAA